MVIDSNTVTDIHDLMLGGRVSDAQAVNEQTPAMNS